MHALPGRLGTRTRRRLVPDRVWHRTPCYQHLDRPWGPDHPLNSFCVFAPGWVTVVGLQRDGSAGGSTARQRQHVTHAEIGRLIGTALLALFVRLGGTTCHEPGSG